MTKRMQRWQNSTSNRFLIDVNRLHEINLDLQILSRNDRSNDLQQNATLCAPVPMAKISSSTFSLSDLQTKNMNVEYKS